MAKGLLLSLEGIDFTWKTPFTQWLSRDFSNNKEVVTTRDPPYNLSPWNLFREYFEKGEDVSNLAEAIMLLAARIDNNQRVILPALSKGALVIADRYFDSWLAYQSVRLSNYSPQSSPDIQKFLIKLNQMIVEEGFLAVPDLTILISDKPERTIQRAEEKDEISKYEVLEVQLRVYSQYQALFQAFPGRITVVDVRKKNIKEAYQIIHTLVSRWLERKNIFPEIDLIKEGNRLMALRRLIWTNGLHEDSPLIVESGDTATVNSVLEEAGQIILTWDKDKLPHLPKAINLLSVEKYSCILLS